MGPQRPTWGGPVSLEAHEGDLDLVLLSELHRPNQVGIEGSPGGFDLTTHQAARLSQQWD